MVIKPYDTMEKLPQRIKIPEHKIGYHIKKIENMHNIIKTRQIIMEQQHNVINKSLNIIHEKVDIV